MGLDPLQRSSERVVPANQHRSRADYASYKFHEKTYEWAASMTRGMRVVDFGCGTGYGSKIVAASAHEVLAVDPSPEAIEYAQEHYAAQDLRFEAIVDRVPVEDGSQDAVISFQVIEHVETGPYLAEVRRMLRPCGFALFATPNREHRLYRWQQPWNRWHLTEYTPEDFGALLSQFFEEVELFGLRDDGELASILRSRWRRTRMLTVPFTLPFIPARMRRTVLRWLSAAQRAKQETFEEPVGTVEVVPVGDAQCEILAVARKA